MTKPGHTGREKSFLQEAPTHSNYMKLEQLRQLEQEEQEKQEFNMELLANNRIHSRPTLAE